MRNDILDTKAELAEWVKLAMGRLPAGVKAANCVMAVVTGNLSNGKASYGIKYFDQQTNEVFAISPISNQLFKTITDSTSHFAS